MASGDIADNPHILDNANVSDNVVAVTAAAAVRSQGNNGPVTNHFHFNITLQGNPDVSVCNIIANVLAAFAPQRLEPNGNNILPANQGLGNIDLLGVLLRPVIASFNQNPAELINNGVAGAVSNGAPHEVIERLIDGQFEDTRDEQGEELCVICVDNKPSAVLHCGHTFCELCVSKLEYYDMPCALCRAAFNAWDPIAED